MTGSPQTQQKPRDGQKARDRPEDKGNKPKGKAGSGQGKNKN
jgi:hypothetical protein